MISNSTTKKLYDTISSDLTILRFLNEEELSYKFRLTYSAIGRWVLSLFADRDFEDDDNNQVSKSHVTITGVDILKSFKKIDPELGAFFPDDNKFINMIEDVYIRIGYINSGAYSFKNQSRTAKIKISDKSLVIDSDSKLKRTRGLGIWGKSSVDDITLSDYLLIKDSAHRYTEKLIDQLRYSEFTPDFGKNEIYNIDKCKWDSFNDKLAKTHKYSIIKIDDGLDYKIIKCINDIVYAASLPSIYTKQVNDFIFFHEVWRVILGICSINGKKAKCIISKKNLDMISIKFNGYLLPALEESLVKCMAWPKDNCLNIFEYVTDITMLESITELLKMLSIDIVVEG